MIGLLLIAHPFSDIQDNTTMIGVAVGVMAAVTIAGSFTMVRVVAVSSHFLIAMFYYCLATTAFAPIAYLVLLLGGHTPTFYTYEQFLRIGVLCIFGFFSQLFLSASYKLEKAGRVSTVRYLQIVLSFVVDVTIFKTEFSYLEVLGALCIVSSNFIIVLLKCLGKI